MPTAPIDRNTHVWPHRALEWSIWAAFISTAWLGVSGTSTIAYLGSYNFTVAEVCLAFAAIAFISGALRYGISWDAFGLAVVVLVSVASMNFLRGFVVDRKTALVAARATLPFAAYLLLATVRYPRRMLREQIAKVVKAVALALTVIVAMRLVMGPQFLMFGVRYLSVSQINDGGRPLPSEAALVLAVAAVFELSAWFERRHQNTKALLFALLFAVALIATGQGTATVVGLIGMAIVFSMAPGSSYPSRVLLGIIFAVVAALIWVQFHNMNIELIRQLLPSGIAENLVRRKLNFETREMIWQGAIRSYENGGSFNRLLGWPTGAMPALIIQSWSWGRVTWKANAHDMYMATLLNQGAIGLLAYLIVLTNVATNSIAKGRRQMLAESLALVTMLAVFSFTYSLPYAQALTLLFVVSGQGTRSSERMGKGRWRRARSDGTWQMQASTRRRP